MKVLVIGSGGREHALAWKLAQSERVVEVIVAPGNAGTATETKCRNANVAVTNIDGLLSLARNAKVDLTVVGPEIPLVAGVVDRFREAGLRIFGPTAAAAQLEGSKAYAKDFLARHGIPTAFYSVFTDVAPALAYVRDKGAPIVVKADGLAAGKGVTIAATVEEAMDALEAIFREGDGARVVIEAYMAGEEASLFLLADGETVCLLGSAQDHKRAFDGDAGPNTGGMGAYSPAPVLTPEVTEAALDRIVRPTLAEMARRGTPYQ
ncbi:MAG: phosphoribosylamine--glycine ligase, partial [Pseudoxanthomonas sp.]